MNPSAQQLIKLSLLSTLILFSTVAVYSQCDRQRDSLALVTLYNTTGGDNWSNAWDLTLPMSNWYGIQLNTEGCVTCIDLDGTPDCASSLVGLGNNLSGSIPPELGQLSELTVLNLANNNLSGMMPQTELSNFTQLSLLDLGNNLLSGCIPPTLSNYCSISIFNLEGNLAMPWEGAVANFCNAMTQINAPCSDGNPATSGEVINPCCQCITDQNCFNDTAPPELSAFFPFDNGNFLDIGPFCPGEILAEQDVLDILVDGAFDFSTIVDNCSDSEDILSTVVAFEPGIMCGDVGFIEWNFEDACGNIATGGPYIAEWELAVDGPNSTPLAWLIDPVDFFPPSDITISYDDSVCTNDFAACMWLSDPFDDGSPNMWPWQAVENAVWEGGCDVNIIYSHLPCQAAIDAVPNQNPPPELLNFSTNALTNTEVCITLVDECDPAGNIQYCFDVTIRCSTCGLGQDVFCPTCSDADRNCSLCDPDLLADGYSSCTPSCVNPTCTPEPGTQPSPLCMSSGVPNNMSWFAFKASSESLTLEVDVGACVQGSGIQAGIYDSCDWENCIIFFSGEESNNCFSTSSSESADNFILGNTYYLWIDGCGGDECEYTITVIGVEFLGLPEIDAITAYSACRDEHLTSNPQDPNYGGTQISPFGSESLCDVNDAITVCPGETLQFSVVHSGNPSNPIPIHQDACNEYSANLSADFIWDVEWLGQVIHNPVEDGDDLFIEELHAPATPGVYEVCLEAIAFDCDPKIGPACLNVHVVDRLNETYIQDVCQEELEFFWDPADAMQDPNGDGLGWLGVPVTLAEVDGWPLSTSGPTDGYRCMQFIHEDPDCLCSVPQTLCIQVVGDGDITLSIESPICVNNSASVLEAPVGNLTWDYDSGVVVDANGNIKWDQAGIYTVQVQSNIAGCLETATFEVVVEPALDDITLVGACDSGLDFVSFDWNDIHNATGYEVELTNTTTGLTEIISLSALESELFMGGLNEDDKVQIVVTAISDLPGCESTATFCCQATTCAQYPPISFNPCEEGLGFVTFSWLAIPGIAEYIITNLDDNIPIAQTELEYTITELAPLQTVTITVQPVHPTPDCSIGPVQFSCTTPCPNIPLMSNVFCSASGVDNVAFDWDDVSGISFYEVTWAINNGMETTDTIQVSELSFPGALWPNDLNQNDEVSVSIVAINPDPICGNSAPEQTTCLASGCTQPIFTDPNLVFCWDPADGPLQLMIAEVVDNNGNPLEGDIEWLSSEVDPISGLFTPSGSSASAVYTLDFEWSDSSAPSECKFRSNITVQVNILPTPVINAALEDICVGETLVLMGIAALDSSVVVTWDFDGGIVSADNWPDQLELNFASPGMKTVTLTETSGDGPNSCSGSTSITFEVLEGDEIIISCGAVTNNSVTFEWDAYPDALGYNYSIDGGIQTLTQDTEVTFDGLTEGDTITIVVEGLFDPVRPCDLLGSMTCIVGNTDATLELNGQEIKIYPNPVDKILYIDYERLELDVSMSTTDGTMIPKVIKDKQIDVSELAAGVYFLIITDIRTGKKYAERIIVL